MKLERSAAKGVSREPLKTACLRGFRDHVGQQNAGRRKTKKEEGRGKGRERLSQKKGNGNLTKRNRLKP